MIPGTLVGKYRLFRQLGRGSMGEVWAAVNVDTDREVALKLITSPDPELTRRLLREARAIGRLEHPNIVQILDRGETEQGEPFLVMQLLQGETLGARMRREGTLTEPVAAGIALDISRALRAAHEKAIIHRDLKPENIFLHRETDTDEDVVKVVDFGVSKLSIENEGASTMQGGILGSPAYMSPEQIRSSGVDGRTDIWALGVILFEMLAGERPFSGTTPVVVLTQILDPQPARRLETAAPHVSQALCNVVAACLERDPGNRVASASELSRLLRPFVTRGRHATIEASVPQERYAALPAPPPIASQRLPASSARADDDKVSTEVLQPSRLLSAALAAQAPGTGTMLIGPSAKPAPEVPSRDSSTTMWQPGMKHHHPQPDPPSVDESDRPTSEILAATVMASAPRPPLPAPPRPPAPPAPRPPPAAVPAYDSGSWPRPPAAPTLSPASGSWPRPPAAPTVSPGSGSWARPPVAPPAAPPVAPGSGSWPRVDQASAGGGGMPPPPVSQPRMPSAPDLSHLSAAERKRVYSRTQPMEPVVLPPPPEEVDLRGGTMKVDPRLLPASPMAGRNMVQPPPPSAVTTTTAPLTALLPPPALPVMLPESPRRWPFVLLAVSIVALIGVAAMLVLTLREEQGGPGSPVQATSPSGSALPSGSASAPPVAPVPTAKP